MVKTTLIPEPKNVNDFGTRVNVVDLPELGAVTKAISANWAYLHLNSDSPHGLYAPIGGIPVQLGCYYFTPSAGSDYNVGMLWSRTPQTAGYARAYSPRSGMIKAVLGHFWNGTAGTSEASNLYLDVTNPTTGTSSHLISSAIDNSSTIDEFLKYDLAIPILQGDYLELRWDCPSSWSTTPQNVHILATVYIDCGSVADQPPAPPPGGEDTYGAGAYDEALGPIGGGADYLGGIYTQATPNDSDHTIYSSDSVSTIVTKISGAHSGDVIFIQGDVDTDMGSTEWLVIPAGVTLASNRGAGGTALGGRLRMSTSKSFEPLLYVTGSNVRVTGMRLQGPDGGITGSSYNEGIRIYGSLNNFEMDNCEVLQWPYGAICYWGDNVTGGLYGTGRGYIHHNYIHNNRRSGLGYGVQVGINATVLIEANIFDYGRHFVSGIRDEASPWADGSRWECRYNILEPNCTNTLLDQHGGNDDAYWGWDDGPNANSHAGDYIYIHHNTSKAKVALGTGKNQPMVGIRGVPYHWCNVYRNWTWWYDTETYPTVNFRQWVDNLGLTPYVNMTVDDNLWGQYSDPS